MLAVYIRWFNLKDSLSHAAVIEHFKFLMEEFLPPLQRANGVRSVKYYSGAGALRADLRIVIEMDDAYR